MIQTMHNNFKDWRIKSFVILAVFASITSLIKIIIFGIFSDFYIPIFWIVLCLFTLFKGFGFFYYLMLLFYILVVVTNSGNGYSNLGIFVLMIMILGKTKIKQVVGISLILVVSIMVCSIVESNMINIFAIAIQFVFALFCYYGFIYIRVQDLPYHSKLIYTADERIVLHALATQDKSQKEVAYELDMSVSEITYVLNKIKKKNSISTTDMLLRLYAIENALNQNS